MEDVVCYLIGGAPRTGKTTLAEKVALEHGTKSLSTDSILVMMMKMVRQEDYPDLFRTHGHTVESFYQKYDTAKKVAEAEVKAGLDAEKGIVAVLELLLPAWKTVVLEGDMITPGFVVRLKEKFPKTSIQATFLYDDNYERIKERIYTKGLWSRSKPYTDTIKPKEIEFVQAFNEWYLHEAKRYGVEITKVND